MRRFQQIIFKPSTFLLTLLAAFIAVIGAHGQSAPYVLPYTMSTFAGPNANYTVGAACNGFPAFKALDIQGDGCPALAVSVGIDAHDIRVDAKGNVYWLDNSSGSLTLVHKISVATGLQTIYLGSNINATPCAAKADTYGDGCPSTDGAANANTAIPTTASKGKNQRGLGIAPNGDLYTAGYNDYNIHKITAAVSPFTYTTTTPSTTIYSGVYSSVAGIVGTTAATTTVTAGPSSSGLGSVRGVGVDASGNVYIADTGNSIIQEVTSSATVCGAIAPPCTVPLTAANPTPTKLVTSGVPASGAIVDAPEDVQIDGNGNIFIADAGNAVLRAICVSGTLPGIVGCTPGYIYTIAGGGATAYPKDGTTPTLLGTSITISLRKIGIDNHNNIFIADSGSNVVWFVDAVTGYIRVAAGSYGGSVASTLSTPYGCGNGNAIGDGCPASLAELTTSFANPDMATSPDSQGNLYITDGEGATTAAVSRLRKVLSGLNFPATATGASLTQTLLVHFGPLDTPKAVNPYSITGTGTDFILGTQACTLNADTTTDCKLPITFKPSVPGYDTATLTFNSTLGGVNSYLLTGTGSAAAIAIDPGTAALFNSTTVNAQGAAIDGAGNVYFADTNNNRVLKYTVATATTATFAGTGTANYTGDNSLATAATLKAPKAVAVDTSGNVYIADTGNNVIRKVAVTTGIISTYAGTGTANYTGDTGLAKSATFSAPSGITADNQGQVYVADTGNNVIRQISADGYIYTLAGGATTICASTFTDNQGDGCAGLQAQFSSPSALAYDATGNFIYVADTGNNNIRRIYLSNVSTALGTTPTTTVGLLNPVSLIAGNGTNGASQSATGIATQSQLNKPTGISVDAAENVYIADTGNSAIRLVNNGIISTIVGILGTSGTGTAPPTSAINVELSNPSAVAVSPLGTLYVVDSGNNRILTDNRTAVSYNFGRVNVTASSPLQPFTETNIGIASATLPSLTQVTATGSTTQFTLSAPTGSGACSPSLSLGVGLSCITNGQFTPTAANVTPYSATYTDTTTYSGVSPSITLVGTGAVLTPTTSTVTQTIPTGTAQYGQAVTLTATVASACNTAAPSCTPTGTFKIGVDGTFSAPIALTGNTASYQVPNQSVGTHTISCQYSGDNFYAASSCQTTPAITITVAQAGTTSVLTATPNNAAQFSTVTLTANVTSNTIGVPTGNVYFYVDGSTTAIGNPGTSVAPSGTSATASVTLAAQYDNYGNLVGAGNTLTPGTHTLTCTFVGQSPSNYATSNCAPVTLTVAPQAASIKLFTRACNSNVLTSDGTVSPITTAPLATLTYSTTCTNPATINYVQIIAYSVTGGIGTFTTRTQSPASLVAGQQLVLSNFQVGTFLNGQTVTVLSTGLSSTSFQAAVTGTGSGSELGSGQYQAIGTVVPVVAVADGSTTDVTILIQTSNNLSGTLTYSCAGMPATTTCTISPQGIVASPSTGVPLLQYIDVTFWTDLHSSALTRPSFGHSKSSTTLAAIFAWPFTILGIIVFLRFRRKTGAARAISLLAMLLVMAGSSVMITSCAGPGANTPVLSPAGTYPITITVQGGGATASTLVYFKVTSPGITGQE